MRILASILLVSSVLLSCSNAPKGVKYIVTETSDIQKIFFGIVIKATPITAHKKINSVIATTTQDNVELIIKLDTGGIITVIQTASPNIAFSINQKVKLIEQGKTIKVEPK